MWKWLGSGRTPSPNQGPSAPDPRTSEDHQTFDRDGAVVPLRDPPEVAERFVLVSLMGELALAAHVHARANASGDPQVIERSVAACTRALDRLSALRVSPEQTESAEDALIVGLRRGGRVREGALTETQWRQETAGVFAWALGLEPSIPADQARLDRCLERLPTDASAFTSFVRSATLRPAAEIHAAKWKAVNRFLPMEFAPPSEERALALEHLRALVWLTEPAHDELCQTPITGSEMERWPVRAPPL